MNAVSSHHAVGASQFSADEHDGNHADAGLAVSRHTIPERFKQVMRHAGLITSNVTAIRKLESLN
jgi:hypothetical protein